MVILFCIIALLFIVGMGVVCLRPGSNCRKHMKALRPDPNSYVSFPELDLILRSVVLVLMLSVTASTMPAYAAKGGKAYRLAHQAAPQEQFKQAPDAPLASVAYQFGQLYVYHNGRVTQIRNLATDFTKLLYGVDKYKGLTAEQVLAGYYYNADVWLNEPIRPAAKGDTATANKCYQLIDEAVSGELFLIVPPGKNGKTWLTDTAALNRVGTLLSQNDHIGAFRALEQIREHQIRFAQDGTLPSSRHLIGLSILGNTIYLHFFSLGILVLGLLTYLYHTTRLGRKRRLFPVHSFFLILMLLLGAGVLGAYLLLGWWVSGCCPLSSVSLMLESGALMVLVFALSFILSRPNYQLRGVVGGSMMLTAGVMLYVGAAISIFNHGVDQLPTALSMMRMLFAFTLSQVIALVILLICYLIPYLVLIKQEAVHQVYLHLMALTGYALGLWSGLALIFGVGVLLV